MGIYRVFSGNLLYTFTIKTSSADLLDETAYASFLEK
jgi:hypothetical protein